MGFYKRLYSLILGIILITQVFSLNLSADAGEERTVYLSATEYDYPPFSVTDNGEADGFSVELLKAVADEMGIIVTFKIDQWSILKEELKNGELDILPLVGYTEERDEIYDFTVPYIVMRGNIFVRKNDDLIQSQEDLFGKEVLVLDGDNSQEWAWSIGLDTELTATTTYLEAFQLLASGQYDAVLAQGLVGEKLISDHNLDNISPVYIYDDGGVTRQKLNLEGYEQKFCFAVVEGDTELLSVLNEGLSIVSVNGRYDELYQKWFPFLLDNDGVSTATIIRYVIYILTPILIALIAAYFILTRRTIKLRTMEIKNEKERSEKYLNDLILSGKIFETSIKNAPIPIMIHDEDGTVLNISQTWMDLTHYNKDDIPKIFDWTEKAYGTKKDDLRQFISTIFSLNKTQHDGEFEVTTKEGMKLIWDFHSMYIGNLPNGKAVAMSVATDVTERVLMDNQLKESEQRFKILHNASFGGIALHDKGLILDCNQGLSDITGYSMDELIGMDGLLLIAPDYRSFVMNKIKTGYEKPYEAFGIRKNNEIYPLRLEARNMPYEGKQVRVVEFKDISEIRDIQDQLIETLEQHKLVLDSTISGIYAIDKEGICTYVNHNALELLGYNHESEVIGKNIHELVHHSYEDGEPWLQEDCFLHQNFLNKTMINKDDIIWRKDGTYFPVVYSSAPQIKNNEVIGAVVLFSDITERKIIERSLIESEIRFKTLFEKAPIGYQSLDENGCFLVVNETWLDMLGYQEDEVVGKWFGDFLSEKHKSLFKERFEIFKKRGKIHSEFWMIHKDGHLIYIEFEGLIGYNKVREFQQTYCTLNDVTDRKRLESALIKEKESLAFTLKSIGDAVIATDSNGLITGINPIASHLTGWSEEEALGQKFNQVFNITFEDKNQIVEDPVEKALLTNQIVELANHTVLISKDGTEYFIEDTAAPIKNADHENIGVVIVFRDVTQKKKNEREIKRLSEHDYLTSLYNRRYYFDKLEYFHRAKYYPLGLMMLDVNGLKIINDAFGHQVGDEALVMIGNVLKDIFGEKDVIARIGGDEFTVLLPNTTPEKLLEYKDTITATMKEKLISNVELSLAVGYELIEKDSDDLDEIQKQAENQMYAHKSVVGTSVRSKAISAILLTLTDKHYTEKRHSIEVSHLCKQIGVELKLNEDDLKELEQAGLFHDIGKIAIPDSILNKPGKLTDEEFEIIKTHTQVGYQILRAADEYSDLAMHALHHHERWDGNGYPSKLKGEKIPLFSRIINIVDAYEAMTADRPYRKKLSKEYAVEEIIRCSGKQFDPVIAKLFVEKVLKKEWDESSN